jgi:hypothetical protein
VTVALVITFFSLSEFAAVMGQQEMAGKKTTVLPR